MLFVLFAILISAFVAIQIWKGENATVPPRIIKQRSIYGAAIFAISIGASFFVFVYYLPIWFQAVKGASAVSSGVMNIPMLLSVVLFTVGSGIIVTSWGYYTPFIIGAAILMPIGYGLMSTLNKESSAAAWIGFQIIAGAGVGIGMQQPLTAVQVVLDIADVPTGTAIIIFAQSLGGALFVTAGQTVFSNRLTAFVMEYAPQVDPGVVLDAGATKIRDIIAAEYLDGVVHAFNSALSNCCSRPEFRDATYLHIWRLSVTVRRLWRPLAVVWVVRRLVVGVVWRLVVVVVVVIVVRIHDGR